MRAYLIYSAYEAKRNSAFADLLLQSAKEQSIDLELVLLEDISYGITSSSPTVWTNKCAGMTCYKSLEDAGFVINRSKDSILSRQFELMGIRVFNSSSVSEMCNDKVKTYQYALSSNVQTIDSVFFGDDYSFLGFPHIVKPRDGNGGRDVNLVQNKEERISHLNKLSESNSLSQKYTGDIGVDIRVYVIGNEILCAMMRKSNEHRSNYSLGGSASLYDLSSSNVSTVKKLLSKCYFDYVGVDFLLSNGEFIFNEIEDVVGARMLYSETSFDPARLFIEHIKSQI